MRAVLPDARVFKEIADALSKMAGEVSLVFTPSELKIMAMDIDQTAYIEMKFPQDMFQEYEVDEETTIGVNATNVKKVLSNAKKGDALVIESDGEEAQFIIKSAILRKYAFRNIEVSLPSLQELELEFKARATLLAQAFKKAMEDIEAVGSTVEFDSDNDAISFRSVGTGKVEVKLTRDSPTLISLEADEPSKSTYDVTKITAVLNIAKLSDTVAVKFSSKTPMMLEFSISTGTVKYLLAPYEIGG